MSFNNKTALIAGATGLVGGHLLKLLLDSQYYKKVTVLTRRSLNLSNEKVCELIINFDELEKHQSLLHADQVFCCLGSTMKKAGSKQQFTKIDHDYPLNLARLTKHHGSNDFMLISAIDANPDSLFLYNKIKGQTERDIKKLGFNTFHIIRPSLIIGERQEKRPLEEITGKMSMVLNKLLFGQLKKYRSIHAEQIAKAMFAIAQNNKHGTHIHQSDELSQYP